MIYNKPPFRCRNQRFLTDAGNLFVNLRKITKGPDVKNFDDLKDIFKMMVEVK